MLNKRNIALIGNPNTGKTSLFNALTGKSNKVANWSGVTVSGAEATLCFNDIEIKLTDLPGCYSVETNDKLSYDETAVAKHLLKNDTDLIVNVIDANNLTRNIYMTLQLLLLGIPVLVVVTMNDLLHAKGLYLDLEKLEDLLGTKCFLVNSKSSADIDRLKEELTSNLDSNHNNWVLGLDIEENIKSKISRDFKLTKSWSNSISKINNLNNNFDIKLATMHNNLAKKIGSEVLDTSRSSSNLNLDKIFLHPFWRFPCLIAIIVVLFSFTIGFAGIFQDPIEFIVTGSSLFLVNLTSNFLGIECGYNSVYYVISSLALICSFIPIVLAMYFTMGILESSGYMARIAFLCEKLMNFLNLPSKALLPLIIGFGCNVPAILGAKSISHKNSRILMILLSPFMSCSARLAVYGVFISAFFPQNYLILLLGLYFIGILVAILTGIIIKPFLPINERYLSHLDFPSYQMPNFVQVLKSSCFQLKKFLSKALIIIIPISLLFACLNEPDKHINRASKKIMPVFAPMGISSDNWPAVAGLLAGTIAKEAVVGTLNSSYLGNEETTKIDYKNYLEMGVVSIKENLGIIEKHDDKDLALQKKLTTSFSSKSSVFAYLLFVLLYFPCLSVLVVICKELNFKWALFSLFWTNATAYSVAVIYYQIANITEHNIFSFSLVSGISVFWWLVYKFIRLKFNYHRQPKSIKTPVIITS